MTDTSSLPITYSTPQPPLVTTTSAASPFPNGSLSDTNQQDEEDYTIKCICAFTDDDGNTVYCEKCDTWQHIECYYQSQKVPEIHFCADCYPRELDSKRATERQRRLRERVEGGDRKTKRPASKSHKKKTKDLTLGAEQVNGWHHERQDSITNGRDQQPPSKKPKTSHRASASVVSLNGVPSLAESRKRASSNVQSYPSPSKSPQEWYRFPAVPKYTPEFLELYDRDKGHNNVSNDVINDITGNAAEDMADWQRDPTKLPQGSQGKAFVYTSQTLEPAVWPDVSLETTRNNDVEYNGQTPKWNFLRLQVDVKKDALLGEVRGEIGTLKDYSLQGSGNRWQELRHPDPFVFFHPHMNIYIDSRLKGTKFRYLRRSCHPNVTLRTFVTPDKQLHHCFVASCDIAAGTELTTQWYFDASFSNPKERLDDDSFNRRSIAWVSLLLATFGDCHCGSNGCLLAPLDHRYSPRSDHSTQPNGRKRKTKNKHAISPLSTGQATNSRAGSEGMKFQDDDEQYDRRSTSSASRSSPQSRDMTPSNIGSLDADPVLGPGLSARDRRKIEAAEKLFERVDKDHTVQKKKKRTSGGSTLNTPTAGSSNANYSTTPNSGSRPSYANAQTSIPFSRSPPPLRPSGSHHASDTVLSKTSSPTTPLMQSTSAHRPYVDASVQTEPEDLDEIEMPPPKRRRFITPTQRLLRRVFEDRTRYERQRASPELAQSASAGAPGIESGKAESQDVEMLEAQSPENCATISSPAAMRSPSSTTLTKASVPPQFPLPSQAAHSHRPFAPPNALRLQLSNLPPVPAFSNIITSGTPISASGTSASSNLSLVQSPFGFGLGSTSYPGLTANAVAPSPAKKKLSLGDYISRKSLASVTPTQERTLSQVIESTAEAVPTSKKQLSAISDTVDASSVMIKPNESLRAEAAAKGGGEGSAVEDIPMKDEPMESQPLLVKASPVTSASVHAPPVLNAVSPSGIPPEVASVLAILAAHTQHRSSPTSSS